MKTLRQLVTGDEFIQLAIRLGLLALLIYWSFVLVSPFVPILAWSVVLAVALYPVYTWLAAVLGGHAGIAALVLTLISLGASGRRPGSESER